MRLLLLYRGLHSTAAMARAPVFGSAAAAGALLPLNPARDRLASPLVRLPLPAGRVFRGVSLRCYAAAAAVAEQHRIKVQNPIVEMDGASVSAPAFQSLLQGLALWMMIDLAALILTPTFQAMR
jgi:isocitrate dehydrogenase